MSSTDFKTLFTTTFWSFINIMCNKYSYYQRSSYAKILQITVDRDCSQNIWQRNKKENALLAWHLSSFKTFTYWYSTWKADRFGRWFSPWCLKKWTCDYSHIKNKLNIISIQYQKQSSRTTECILEGQGLLPKQWRACTSWSETDVHRKDVYWVIKN